VTLPASIGFPALMQEFFCQRLIAQRNVSPSTVASYRDGFRLLLSFAEKRLHKTPSAMNFTDFDAPMVLEFLDYIERERGNAARSRNLRLTAIRSFMRFASQRDPTILPTAQRVLAIPTKRFDRPMVGFLSRDEIEVIQNAPNPARWSGRRDRVLIATLYNTGARVSEIVGVRRRDLTLDRSPFICLHGKGRKERSVPLWRATTAALRAWLAHLPQSPDQPIFPNRAGHAMTRSGVETRLDAAVQAAQQKCPTLRGRRISPHVLRHTTAMHLLQAGVDITVIALWLGHESTATTHLYVEADLQMKERALAKVPAPEVSAGRYKPGDTLLAFLEGL
jgi:site-specific recombinase XerD